MFYTTFAELCHKIGKSPSFVALELGINKSTVTYWKNNPNAFPTNETLCKIADFFNVTTDYLRNKDTESNTEDAIQTELYEKRKVLFDKSNKATAEQLDTIINLIDQLTQNNE